jgi:hypothetical protein
MMYDVNVDKYFVTIAPFSYSVPASPKPPKPAAQTGVESVKPERDIIR